jgi:hypothetical protein
MVWFTRYSGVFMADAAKRRVPERQRLAAGA